MLTHLPCNSETKALMAPFRRMLAVRNLRDCFVSYMRYVAEHDLAVAPDVRWTALPEGRTRMEGFAKSIDAEHFFGLVHPMLDWRLDPGLITVRYEDIMGDKGSAASEQAVQALTEHLTGDRTATGAIVLSDITSRKTITSSGRRSRWQECWSDATKLAFERLGGNQMNRSLGYE